MMVPPCVLAGAPLMSPLPRCITATDNFARFADSWFAIAFVGITITVHLPTAVAAAAINGRVFDVTA
jgi:hypothetical protein